MDAIIRGANWYCEELNQRLRTTEVQLPSLSRAMETLTPGGGWFQIEMPGEIEALTATIKLNGSHGDIRSRFGREPGDWNTFFYYERLRDIVNGTNTGRLVRLKGLVTGVTQPNVTGLRADPTEYTLGTIVLYHDMVDGQTIHKFDVFNNVLIINGVDYTAEANRILAA